jgi:hypothetical protein
MTARLRTIAAGALYGIAAGACAALAVLRFVPNVGHPVTWHHLSWDFAWAIFYSWPAGLLIGAGAGAFLYWRAQRVASFRKLVVEVSTLAAAAVGAVTQVVLPIAWELPRLQITLISVVSAATLAAVGTRILKPIYWPTRAPAG